DVVADQPEVDDVTAGAKLGRRLDEHHLLTGFSQSVSERRTRDARPVDDNPHAHLGWPNIKASSRSAPHMDIPRAAGPGAAHPASVPVGLPPARTPCTEICPTRVHPRSYGLVAAQPARYGKRLSGPAAPPVRPI